MSVSSSLPSLSSVTWAAFRSGGLAGVVFRPGRRHAGATLAVVFRSLAAAQRFAAGAGPRLAGRPVALAPVAARSGRLWAVSVPVAASRPACAVPFAVAGGVRGAALVASALTTLA